MPRWAAADDPAPTVLAAFEGAEAFASPPNAGIFGWGSDADDPPAMELLARDDAPSGEKAKKELLRKGFLDSNALLAAVSIDVALHATDWSGPKTPTALAALGQAGKYLDRTKVDSFADDDAVVGAARWIAQDQIGQDLDEATSKLTSDAEHLALSGDLSTAIAKLIAAYKL